MTAFDAGAGFGLGATARPREKIAVAGLACTAALWALLHPYVGIYGDATVYIGRALADLDPAGVGRDLMFAHDGQSRFSVFPLLARLLVDRFGTDAAAQTIAIAAAAAWIAALVAFAFQFARGRLAWLIIVFMVALPPSYGEPRHFMFAEMTAVARPFAEAAVLTALAAELAGRRLWTVALLAVALLFHPLMALGGVAVVFLLRAATDRRWLLAAGIAAAAVVALGIAGVPVASRVVTMIDPAWMLLLTDRGPFVYPLYWTSEAYGTLAIQAATIVIGASLVEGPRRRLLITALLAGLGGVAIALVADLFPVQLLVQLQTWRATWLMAVMAEACLALCAVTLWRQGPHARLTLAVLALGWFFDPDATVAVPVAVCAIALHLRGARLAPRLGKWPIILVWGCASGLILLARGGQFVSYLLYLRDMPADAPFDMSVIVNNGIQALPICVVAAVWTIGRWRWPPVAAAGVACGLAALATCTWDARPPLQKLIDTGRHPPDFERLIASRPGEVLWLGGLAEAWFVLGRPQWQSEEQAVSMIFSRDLAREWEPRTRALLALGLVKPTSLVASRKIGYLGPVHMTSHAVATLCARPDAPSWIIVPLTRKEPRPEGVAYESWQLPQPLVEVRDDGDGVIWDWLEGYGVVACGGGPPARPLDVRPPAP